LETRTLPVGEAVSHVYASLPIKLLAAHSINGEQAVANLEKIRQQAGSMGREEPTTLKEVVAMLQRRVSEVREEGESALTEENVNAVRILSIHKAKGLEFPVVVLAGCHAAMDGREEEAAVEYDWSTSLVGLKMRDYWNLPGIFLSEKRKLRDGEEQKRVLYVAMTRAREHLKISCGSGSKRSSGSFLSMLEGSLGSLSSLNGSTLVPAGNGRIEFHAIRERLIPPRSILATQHKASIRSDWKSYAQLWQQRTKEYEEIIQKPFFVTPTLLKRRGQDLTDGVDWKKKGRTPSTDAAHIGELAHRFLQKWNFSIDPQGFQQSLFRYLVKCFGASPGAKLDVACQELERLFQTFFKSPAYEELRTSHILGREIPLCIPWDGQVMEGIIDVLYERDGNLYVADYKTDHVSKESLSQVTDSYRHQAEVYSEAVRRSLQRDVAGFKLVFLRLGESVTVL
jgi:ATP-dependent helicase/nuclease subunit A